MTRPIVLTTPEKGVRFYFSIWGSYTGMETNNDPAQGISWLDLKPDMTEVRKATQRNGETSSEVSQAAKGLKLEDNLVKFNVSYVKLAETRRLSSPLGLNSKRSTQSDSPTTLLITGSSFANIAGASVGGAWSGCLRVC
jgi:hypothetical protein